MSAIFRSGNNIIDERRGYVNMRLAQSLLEKPSLVSQIIVTLRDPDRAPALANHFEELFGHRSRSWQEREAGNLQVFNVLRISAGITVSLIILLAGVLIFNTLTMTVLDKVREIAILRSMGYRRLDITVIFVFQGFLIALLGSLLGAAFGALITYLLSQIPIKVRGILYTDHFIVAWSPQHYYYAALIAFFAVITASYFRPAARPTWRRWTSCGVRGNDRRPTIDEPRRRADGQRLPAMRRAGAFPGRGRVAGPRFAGRVA